jgi:hypothetical protein
MKEEENGTTATTVAEKPTKIYDSYLENRKVEVKAVEAGQQWRNLLAAGQEMKKEPFMFDKVKKSFQVPLMSAAKGGGVKQILNDIERKLIKKYEAKYPDGMTEREFFEEELGEDLSPYGEAGNNFWRDSKRARVTLTKQGMTLDLSTPVGMLRYKILLANKNLICPSYEERGNRATYQFMIVNPGKLTSKKAEAGKIKSRAFAAYAKITADVDSMKGFIRALGRAIPANFTQEWMEAEILDVLEESPGNFLRIVEDPTYEAKIFIQKAVECGAIKKMNDRRYTLDNGIEIGDLTQAIQYLSDPEKQEVKLRIKSQIEMAKK